MKDISEELVSGEIYIPSLLVPDVGGEGVRVIVCDWIEW